MKYEFVFCKDEIGVDASKTICHIKLPGFIIRVVLCIYLHIQN